MNGIQKGHQNENNCAVKGTPEEFIPHKIAYNATPKTFFMVERAPSVLIMYLWSILLAPK